MSVTRVTALTILFIVSPVVYKDADGNIVSAGTLPTFNIKVTGFAVQASTFADYNEAQPELIKLVNSKTSDDAQF